MNSPYIPIALQAVKAAEAVIMRHYQNHLEVMIKDDLTPVTVADREAEEAVKRTIREAFPDHTFYGEEGEKADLNGRHGFTWIIDPIDGTKNFIRGIPIFSTFLALMHDGEIIAGASNAPAWKELLYAAKGEGAFQDGKKLQVSDVNEINMSYISSGRLAYFEKTGNLQQFLELNKQARWSRGFGDFWSYHLLAQGKIDVMAEASVKLWDIAAAKIIVEEAGGKVTQLDGKPITHESTDILATNGLLHDKVLAAISS